MKLLVIKSTHLKIVVEHNCDASRKGEEEEEAESRKAKLGIEEMKGVGTNEREGMAVKNWH